MTADRGPDPGATGPRPFCGYCGSRASGPLISRSRVCPNCEMGLLLTAAGSEIPTPGEPFLVLDQNEVVQAVSREAERLFRAPEGALVGRRAGDVLRGLRLGALPAAEAPGASLDDVARLPDGTRCRARTARCEPGSATLVVLTPLS
jgi:hypothetical protein